MAVTFDNVASSSSTTAGAGSLTWAHNVAASANLLLVCVSLDGTNNPPASGWVTVTAGGVSMTQSASSPVNNANQAGLWIFQLFNPPTGSSVSIVATNAGGVNTNAIDAFIGGSLSFIGASTLGTPVALASQTGASISATVTGVASTSMVAGFCSAGDSINTPSPGSSKYIVNAKGSSGSTDGNSAGAVNTGTGSVTITWGGMPAGDSNNSWGVEITASAVTPNAIPPAGIPVRARIPQPYTCGSPGGVYGSYGPGSGDTSYGSGRVQWNAGGPVLNPPAPLRAGPLPNFPVIIAVNSGWRNAGHSR